MTKEQLEKGNDIQRRIDAFKRLEKYLITESMTGINMGEDFRKDATTTVSGAIQVRIKELKAEFEQL